MQEIKMVVGAAEEEGKKIKLIKNGKGYGWEIQCSGKTVEEILNEIWAADATLKEWYPCPGEAAKEEKPKED